MADNKKSKNLFIIGIIISIVSGFYLISLYSYLLFHAIIEITAIAIGITLFMLIQNTHRFLPNNYLTIIGIGYAFASCFDVLHVIAYKGINVFPVYSANLPSQLWIAARYLQAATLFAAPLFMKYSIKKRVIFIGYAAAASVLAVLFFSGNFPVCYIDGEGLTSFKIGSEYLITAFLLISMYLLYRKRKYFNKNVFYLILSSVFFTVLSELFFTAHVNVYSFANVVGHIAKLAAFYLIYRAIIVTGFNEPFNLIFRDLKKAEEELIKTNNSLDEKVRKRTVELHASEKKYRSLIQAIQAAIVVHGSQTEVITSNSFAQTMLGLTEDQMKGKDVNDPAWNFIRENGSVMPVEKYPVSRVMSTGSPIRDYIVGINRPDSGTIVWALVNADPEFDDEGKLFQVLVSFVDVTERKKTKETLLMERNRMEIILSSLKTGLSLINPDMTISWVNKKIREMFPVGEPVGQICHVFYENSETICKGCGAMQAFLYGKVFESRQFVPFTGRWYNIISQPVKDEAGRVVNVLEGITDITERKLAEEMQQKNEELFRTTVENVSVVLYRLDSNGVFQLSVGAGLVKLGIKSGEMVGRSVFELYRDFPEIVENHRLALAGKTRRFTVEIAGIFFDTSILPVFGMDDEVQAVIGVWSDISERKYAEDQIHRLNEELEEKVIDRTADLNRKSAELSESQMALMNIVEDMNMKTLELEQANIKLQELDRLKSMFIASMSHELRTPLNSIIGFSSIMLNEWVGKMNSEQKENLSTILRSGKHLLSLINDVIDVSKIESGNIETYPEDIDLYDVMQEAAGSFANDIQKKGIDLQINLIHQIIRTDRRRLLQCVLNLISNAVKYTEKGMICVTAELLHEEDAVKISVSDTGIGIKQEDMLNLFSAFIRFDSPLRSTIPGTGLGLYLTKKITREILKGDISASSIYEKGSLFTLKIPVK